MVPLIQLIFPFYPSLSPTCAKRAATYGIEQFAKYICNYHECIKQISFDHCTETTVYNVHMCNQNNELRTFLH